LCGCWDTRRSDASGNLGALEALLRTIPDHDRVLAELARTLARKLDDDAGLATAGIAKEYRALLAELNPGSAEDDGPMDEWTGLSA
jgi:hypothetical protein